MELDPVYTLYSVHVISPYLECRSLSELSQAGEGVGSKDPEPINIAIIS